MADKVPAPRAGLLWALAVAVVGMLIGILILSLASSRLEQPALQAFLIGWIVVPYVLSGLVAWWRRPSGRLGPLMLLLGFSMMLSPLQWSSQPLMHSIGHLFDMVPAAIFLHLFLAFPTGRLTRRPERLLVVFCYAVTMGLQLLKIVLGVNTASLFAVADEAALGNVVEAVQLCLVALSLLTGVILLHRHRNRPGRAPRRPARLVVDAFDIALILLAALYIAGLFEWPFVEPLRLITFAALGLAPLAFLFALLDIRLARGDVAALLVELGGHPTADLQTPLAKAIRDPSLRLFYWLPEQGLWVDQLGEPTAPPRSDDRNAVRILCRDDQPLAALTFDPALEDEYELLDTVLATAGIALENGRLRAELRARLQDLKRSRVRVLEAGRRERQRLERDLHDGAQVRLVALSLQLGLLEEDPATDSSLRVRLHEARAGVLASLQELRDIAHGIYPAVVSDHGLSVALESLVARSSVPVELDVDVPDRPPEAVAVAAYYVVSEALANVGKHAAASQARVQVWKSDHLIMVDVSDDGIRTNGTVSGPGLRGLADRVDVLGGRLQVSQAAAGGVRVHAEIPCP